MLTILDTSTLRRLSVVSHKAVIIICQSLVSYLYSKFNCLPTSNSGGVVYCVQLLLAQVEGAYLTRLATMHIMYCSWFAAGVLVLSSVSRGVLAGCSSNPPPHPPPVHLIYSSKHEPNPFPRKGLVHTVRACAHFHTFLWIVNNWSMGEDAFLWQTSIHTFLWKVNNWSMGEDSFLWQTSACQKQSVPGPYLDKAWVRG